MDKYQIVRVFYKDKGGTFISYVCFEHNTHRELLLTTYSLDKLAEYRYSVIDRYNFIRENKSLFNCYDIFISGPIYQIIDIGKIEEDELIYIVEPLRFPTLSASIKSIDMTCLCEVLIPRLTITLRKLQNMGFAYCFLSPLTILYSSEKLYLRPPPLCPCIRPKAILSPYMTSEVYESRSIEEIESYMAPEVKKGIITPSADSWSFGATLLDIILYNGAPVFSSISSKDLRQKIQRILGPAPKEFNWELPFVFSSIELPPPISKLLKYNASERELINPKDFDNIDNNKSVRASISLEQMRRIHTKKYDNSYEPISNTETKLSYVDKSLHESLISGSTNFHELCESEDSACLYGSSLSNMLNTYEDDESRTITIVVDYVKFRGIKDKPVEIVFSTECERMNITRYKHVWENCETVINFSLSKNEVKNGLNLSVSIYGIKLSIRVRDSDHKIKFTDKNGSFAAVMKLHVLSNERNLPRNPGSFSCKHSTMATSRHNSECNECKFLNMLLERYKRALKSVSI